MPLMCHIDQPANREITHTRCEIHGWCSIASPEELQGIRFEIGGVPVLHHKVHRPDVEAVQFDRRVRGFVVHFDLSYYMHAILNDEIVLKLIVTGEQPLELRFKVLPPALAASLAAASGR
jgi:hypothetical protein